MTRVPTNLSRSCRKICCPEHSQRRIACIWWAAPRRTACRSAHCQNSPRDSSSIPWRTESSPLIAVAVFADIDFLRSPSPYSRQKRYHAWRPRHYALFGHRFGTGYVLYESCPAEDLRHCRSAHAPAQLPTAEAAPPALRQLFETLSPGPSFDQGAATLLQRPERLVARNGGEQLVEVPWSGRFARRLELHQIHVVDHAPVLADAAVLREEIVDRGGLHFGDHRFGVIGAGRVDRLEIVCHRRIHAC